MDTNIEIEIEREIEIEIEIEIEREREESMNSKFRLNRHNLQDDYECIHRSFFTYLFYGTK